MCYAYCLFTLNCISLLALRLGTINFFAIAELRYTLTAFDTVDHEMLLNKLKRYGIRGIPLQFISCYLSNRKMLTVVNGVTSNNQNITCGVLQGSN